MTPLDLEELLRPRDLRRYLDSKGLGEGSLSISELGDGHSNLTFRIERDDRVLVLRRPPRPPYPAKTHDVAREGRLIGSLAATGLPVPEVFDVCEESGPIGAPFFIAEFIDGRVLGERLPPDLSSRPVLSSVVDEVIKGLVSVGSVAWSHLGLRGNGVGYLDRQLALFGDLSRSTRLCDDRSFVELKAWLERERPGMCVRTLVHGDYRLGNLMFATSGARLASILDWELSTIGDPLADLGWLLALWAEPDDPSGLIKLSPLTSSPAFPDRTVVLESYLNATGGLPGGASPRWYVIFALWKFSLVMEANYSRAAGGRSSDSFALAFGSDIPDLIEFALELTRSRRAFL